MKQGSTASWDALEEREDLLAFRFFGEVIALFATFLNFARKFKFKLNEDGSILGFRLASQSKMA